jgi:putative FmdB family regulatory protein
MPVYEYDCPACGRRFSRYFRSPGAAAAPVPCECGHSETRRAISGFQVQHSLKSKIDRIDPQIEKEIDWAERPHKATDPLNRVNLDFDRQVERG